MLGRHLAMQIPYCTMVVEEDEDGEEEDGEGQIGFEGEHLVEGADLRYW